MGKIISAFLEKATKTRGWIYYVIGALLLLNLTNCFIPIDQYIQTIASAATSKVLVSAIHIAFNCLLIMFTISGTIVLLGKFIYKAMEKLCEKDCWYRHGSIRKIKDFAFFTYLKTQDLCQDTYEYLLTFVLAYFLLNKTNYSVLTNQLLQFAQGHVFVFIICMFWSFLYSIETVCTLYKKFFYATKISDTKE